MSSEDNIYRKLQQHLDKIFPVGFPEASSGVDIRLLQQFFTLEDAKIALHLSNKLEPLDQIRNRIIDAGLSDANLEEILDKLTQKGAILGFKKGEIKFYSGATWAVGISENQVDKDITKEFAEDAREYDFNFYFKEWYKPDTPSQMRTIPIEKSLTPEHHVATYDTIRQLIEDCEGPFAVLNCGCRQMRDITNHSCTRWDIRETCIMLRGTAKMDIANGIGRQITKEEALEILQRGEEEGMILQPENSQSPNYICCCCGCCCRILGMAKQFSRPADFFQSNYYVEVNPELCEGCGTCVTRCHLDARTLIDNVSTVNLDHCIGCGNCVVTCEAKATILKKHEKEFVPPENTRDLYKQIMLKKNEQN